MYFTEDIFSMLQNLRNKTVISYITDCEIKWSNQRNFETRQEQNKFIADLVELLFAFSSLNVQTFIIFYSLSLLVKGI